MRARRGEPARNAAAPKVFLGSLRSEFDEASELHPVCKAVARAHDHLLGLWHRSAIRESDLLERLALLRCTDADGTEFTLGATSQRWYSRGEDRRWRLSPPPDASQELYLVPGAYEWAMRDVTDMPLAAGTAHAAAAPGAPGEVVERSESPAAAYELYDIFEVPLEEQVAAARSRLAELMASGAPDEQVEAAAAELNRLTEQQR